MRAAVTAHATSAAIPICAVRGLRPWALWCAVLVALAATVSCSDSDQSIKTSAGYALAPLDPSDLPTYAVGDSFTYDKPKETWTVVDIHDGLVKWTSSLGAKKTTVFDPILPPIAWTKHDGSGGSERLTNWNRTLFPLKKRQKISFRSIVRRTGKDTPIRYVWKCYSGAPRKVKVKAGEFPAYPVFCRRSDGWTIQSFYAPDVNGPLLITTRKRPARAETRELTAFKKGPGPRIAARKAGSLPKGWALAAVDRVPPAAAPEAGPAIAAAPAPPLAGAAASYKVSGDSRSHTSAAPAPVIPAPRPAEKTSAVARRTGRTRTASPAIPPPRAPRTPRPAKAAPPLPVIAAVPTANATRPAGNGEYGFGVQIGSFQNPDNATRSWPTLQRRYEPLLKGWNHVIERVYLGPSKGRFHRLIAGPVRSRAQAAELCRAIRKRGADCVVRRVKG